MEGEKGPADHIFVKNLYSQYRKISNILNPIIENIGVHKVHFLMMASQYLPDLNSERRPPAYLVLFRVLFISVLHLDMQKEALK